MACNGEADAARSLLLLVHGLYLPLLARPLQSTASSMRQQEETRVGTEEERRTNSYSLTNQKRGAAGMKEEPAGVRAVQRPLGSNAM